MADLPILFSAPMVRAILREIEQPGTGKTQTRRVLSPQPPRGDHYGKDIMDWGLSGIYQDDENSAPNKWWLDVQTDVDDNSHREISVRYAVGDRLYVREAWRSETAYDDLSPASMGGEEPIRYEADGSHQSWGYPAISKLGRFRQGMHMPRWASRITLIVTDVRVQRLQEISREDAIAEGLRWLHALKAWTAGDNNWPTFGSPIRSFAGLWNHINASRGFGWDANPWVAAYTFRPLLGNIDQVRP